jgi:hypothetical protein
MAGQEQKQAGAYSLPQMNWWVGTVINRNDPKMVGRCTVRIRGYHTKDKGEIPDADLPWAIPIQKSTSAAMSGIGESPTGFVEGTTVVGYWGDGRQAQMPVIFGSMIGTPAPANPEDGFDDPNGKYPSYDPGEPDTNRLARNEKIDQTIVQTKLDNLDESEISQFSESGERPKWKEHPTQYAAKYPFNHVRESECGHVMEVDDTGGAERLSTWHKSGTFQETDPQGIQVEKIMKDNYQIIMKDNYQHIYGDTKFTCEQNENYLIKANQTIEIAGNVERIIHQNYQLKVMGDMVLEVKGDLTFKVGGDFVQNTEKSYKLDTANDEIHVASAIHLN